MSREGKAHSVSRRKFIRTAAITSGGLALAVCAPPIASAQAIKRGGQLVTSKQWTYASLDPHLTSEPEMAGYEALFNGLVRFELVDPKTWEHKLVGDLAESWQQPDPKTLGSASRTTTRNGGPQPWGGTRPSSSIRITRLKPKNSSPQPGIPTASRLN